MANDLTMDFSIYAKLWKSGDDGSVTRLGSGQDTLYVPHTVVFVDGVPFAWYFSSLIDGRYKRRSRKKLLSEEIYQHFAKQSRNRARARAAAAPRFVSRAEARRRRLNANATSPQSPTDLASAASSGDAAGAGATLDMSTAEAAAGGKAHLTTPRSPTSPSPSSLSSPRSRRHRHRQRSRSFSPPTSEWDNEASPALGSESIVAVWMTNALVNGANAPRVTARYLTLPDLRHFLFSETKNGAGVLQQIIHCSGNVRRGLRCHWSPHITSVEMCVNKWTVTNPKVDVDVRMSDVHGRRGDILVSKLDLSTKLGTRIKMLSDVVAQRMEQLANLSRDGRLLIDITKAGGHAPWPTQEVVAKGRGAKTAVLAVPTFAHLLDNDEEKKKRHAANMALTEKLHTHTTDRLFEEAKLGQQTKGRYEALSNNKHEQINDGEEHNEEHDPNARKPAAAAANAAPPHRSAAAIATAKKAAEARFQAQEQARHAYLDAFLRGASFQDKRNLLGVRLQRATFNFAIGDDNRTYLTFVSGMQVVDTQPVHQKRKKRSNAHTLEIEMLETASRNQREMMGMMMNGHIDGEQARRKSARRGSLDKGTNGGGGGVYKNGKWVPQPSPMLEKMGLGLLPKPEEDFYADYSDKNYEPEDKNEDRDELAGTGFSVREMLRDGAEMLRAFFRRYAHAKTGKLNLRSVFRSLDTSGDGQISSIEFRDLFREANIHLTRSQLFQVIRLFDEDCDGRVSIDEFEKWIVTDPVRRVPDNLYEQTDDIYNVRSLTTDSKDNDKQPRKSKAWGANIDLTKALPKDSVLQRRMRAVGNETAAAVATEMTQERATRLEARSHKLAKDILIASGMDPTAAEEQLRKEKAAATAEAEAKTDSSSGGESAGADGADASKEDTTREPGAVAARTKMPDSIERAYGTYRAHYNATVGYPMSWHERAAKVAGLGVDSPRRMPGRTLRLSQPKKYQLAPKKTDENAGKPTKTMSIFEKMDKQKYGHIYGLPVESPVHGKKRRGVLKPKPPTTPSKARVGTPARPDYW